MSASRFRAALAVVALVFAPLAASDAQQAKSAEQLRAEQAVVDQMKAAQSQALDQGAAMRVRDLQRDPASPVLGNAQGDVTIVEFVDYTCPYCKAIQPRLEKFVKNDKRVRLVIKEYPILVPESLVGAKAGLAAAKQGKYEAFHNTLMNFRGQLTNEVIFDTAKSVGLDLAKLRKDMESPEIGDAIIANFNLARGLRIFQTPTFIVGTHVLTEDSAAIDFPKRVAEARAKTR